MCKIIFFELDVFVNIFFRVLLVILSDITFILFSIFTNTELVFKTYNISFELFIPTGVVILELFIINVAVVNPEK